MSLQSPIALFEIFFVWYIKVIKLHEKEWVQSVCWAAFALLQAFVLTFVFHSLTGRILRIPPGTMNYQVLVIPFLPTAVRSAVCSHKYTFHLTPSLIVWRRESCLEGLRVFIDQRGCRLITNREFTVTNQITSTDLWVGKVRSLFSAFWEKL